MNCLLLVLRLQYWLTTRRRDDRFDVVCQGTLVCAQRWPQKIPIEGQHLCPLTNMNIRFLGNYRYWPSVPPAKRVVIISESHSIFLLSAAVCMNSSHHAGTHVIKEASRLHRYERASPIGLPSLVKDVSILVSGSRIFSCLQS